MKRIESVRHKRMDALSTTLCVVGVAEMGLAGCVLIFSPVFLAGESGASVVMALASCVALAVSGLVLWAAGEALWILWEIREQLVPEPAAQPIPAQAPPPEKPKAIEPAGAAASSVSCPSCGYRIARTKGATAPGPAACPVCKTPVAM